MIVGTDNHPSPDACLRDSSKTVEDFQAKICFRYSNHTLANRKRIQHLPDISQTMFDGFQIEFFFQVVAKVLYTHITSAIDRKSASVIPKGTEILSHIPILWIRQYLITSNQHVIIKCKTTHSIRYVDA